MNKKKILYAGLLLAVLQPLQTHSGYLSKILKNFRSSLWMSFGGTVEIQAAFQKVNEALLLGAYIEMEDWKYEEMEDQLKHTILFARLEKIEVDIDHQGAQLREVIKQKNAAQKRVVDALKNACTDLQDLRPKIYGEAAEGKFNEIAFENYKTLFESIPHISKKAYLEIGEYCGFPGFDLEKREEP